MSAVFVSVFEPLADRLTTEIDHDLRRMNEQQAHADTLSAQAKTDSPDGGALWSWSDPAQLRTWSQTQQTADRLFRSALQRGAVRSCFMLKAYRHSAWCAVRAVAHAVHLTVRQSLAQVSAVFTAVNGRSKSPPVLLPAPSVLATCHASNAPGLSPIAMHHRQVTTRE